MVKTRNKSNYSAGYGSSMTEIMANRKAEFYAKFILPYLKKGMNILDFGCGPGGISLGLAETVAPGYVIGTDIEITQLHFAQNNSKKNNIKQTRFVVSDVHDLPFQEATFDAAFGNTVLMQCQNPMMVIEEIYRVLKNGGIIGIREPDAGGNIFSPLNSALEQFWGLHARYLSYSGGDPNIGRRLGALLHEGRFHEIIVSAEYECTKSSEIKQMAGDATAKFCEEAPFVEKAISLGWLEPKAKLDMINSLRAESLMPETFFAAAYCEAVGLKQQKA